MTTGWLVNSWAMSITAAALLPLGSGCSTLTGTGAVQAAPARSLNVYRAAPVLPADVQRVVLLPVSCDADLSTEQGRDGLERVLRAELAGRSVFELATVSSQQLKQWTGQSHWTSVEVLPADFLERMRKATGAHAVLFAHLTVYRPYRPVAVGWKLTLVDADDGSVIWAVDEVFDSADAATAQAAARFYAGREPRRSLAGADGILMSPRRFGAYAAWAALETMPAR